MKDVNVKDVAQCLEGLDFPANKSQIIDQAKENEADDDTMKVLEKLPEREYRTMANVMHEVGQEEGAEHSRKK